MMSLFNLEKQIGFYAQYHHDKVNFALHVVGVPLLLWSALGLVAPLYVSEPPSWLGEAASSLGVANFRIHAGLIASLVYAIGYMFMEPVAGTLAALMVIPSGYYALEFRETVPDALYYLIVLQLACWGMQFFGHFAFEGRAPALFDNIFQSFYAAPLFVLLEIMFMFGYRKDLANHIYDNAARDVAAFKAKSATKAE